MCELANCVALAQKPIKVSRRNFIFRYFILRLRADRTKKIWTRCLVLTKFRTVNLEGWTAIGIRCTCLWNYVELFWNSLDNAPSSIVFYLEIKVEVGVHDIRSRFTPLLIFRPWELSMEKPVFSNARGSRCIDMRWPQPIFHF